MRSIELLASTWCWLTAAAALGPTAPATAQGSCYELSQECPPGPGAFGSTPHPKRAGEPLDGGAPGGDQRAGVQAAIDMLADWVAGCGLDGPTPPGGAGPVDPAGLLQSLLDGGHICEEKIADPSTTGATSSNPGNDGLDANNCHWQTTGHPGINVNGPYFPPRGSDGAFSERSVAELASMLLHELSHLVDPQPPPTTGEAYEKKALEFTIAQLCKVAGCEAASEEVKSAVCAYILDQNKELCAKGFAQVCCEACEGCAMVHCEGGGDAPFPGAFVNTTTDRYYSHLDLRGHVSLHVGRQEIDFDLWDADDQALAFAVDCADPQLAFTAVSFTQLDPFTLLVGGFDPLALEGKLLRVVFDPFAGQVLHVGVELASPDLLVAASLDLLPSGRAVAVLDRVGDAVFVYEPATSRLTRVADAGDAPAIATADYVHAWPIRHAPASAGPLQHLVRDGVLLWATAEPESDTSLGALLRPYARIVDEYGDGVFEWID